MTSAPDKARRSVTWAAAAALLLLGGCTGELDDDEDDGASDASAAEVTWHGEIRALVEQNCVTCHTEGGVGPFPFESFEQVEPLAGVMVGVVQARRMPPWPMDPDCRDVERARVLDDEAIALFAQWAAEGFAEGDPAEYVAPQPEPGEAPPALGAPALTLAPGEPYTAQRALGDDYRCLPLEHTFARETFVTALDIVPDQRALVHHVLLYAVAAASLPDLEARDAAEAGPGYTCFGGAGVPGSQLVGGWVPGMQPTIFPAGSGVRLEPGSQLVMQVHYNLGSVADDAPVPADQSAVALWTAPQDARPDHRIALVPIAQTDLFIPAGDPLVSDGITVDVAVPATVVGVMPHMHMLGTQTSLTLERWDGSDEVCLSRIAQWDFEWQQYYAFDEADFVRALPGDRLHLSCTWDNSAANQPRINGEQQPPRDVSFGEGSLDEMCLTYMAVRTPDYRSGSGVRCDGAAPCLAACPPEDAACALLCLDSAEGDCLQCNLAPLFTDCASALCPMQAAAFGSCQQGCTGGALLCAFTECADALAPYFACLGPQLQAGGCNAHTDACGLTLP